MKKKGRRLKRYLGLRREAGMAWSGGIEHLVPGQISGWVVAQGVPLQEVRLLVGPHLIARAEINQARPDVCEKLGWQGTPGFSLELPAELPPVDWQPAPRLLALSADGSQQVELGLLGRPQQTAERLKALLQSDLLGLVGHCDGLVMGAIRGWACRRGQQRPAQIWLQADGQEPIPVSCDGHHDALQAMNLPSQSAFVLDPATLPQAWAGLEVWCSFDREAQFRLPQQSPIALPSRAGLINGSGLQAELSGLLPSTVAMPSNYQAMLQAAPEDLSQHWQALEAFRAYLEGIEHQLAQEQQRRDLASQNQKPSVAPWRRWWERLPGGRGR
jgi:hypothetical protein